MVGQPVTADKPCIFDVDIAEIGDCDITLVPAFGSIGEKAFSIALRRYDAPLVEIECPNFINENAIVRGSRGIRDVVLTIKNIKREDTAQQPEIEIASLSSDADWLDIDSVERDRNYVLPEKELEISARIDLERLSRIQHDITDCKLLLKYRDNVTDAERALTPQPILSVQLIDPKVVEHIIIDFGTSNSCVCRYSERERRPVILGISSDGGKVLQEYPTCVYFKCHNKPEYNFGLQVKELRFKHEDRISGTAYNFKMMLDEIMSRVYVDESKRAEIKTPEEMVGIFTKYLFDNSGVDTTKILLTYPAVFSPAKRIALKNAVDKIAGGRNVELLISEPEALAVHYAYDKNDDETFVIFDMGGGTTDISICRIESKDETRHLDILFTDGDAGIGGELLTFKIARMIFNKLPYDIGKSFNFPQDLQAVSQLKGNKSELYCQIYSEAERIKENNDELIKLKNGTPLEILIKAPESTRITISHEDIINAIEQDIMSLVNKLKDMINVFADRSMAGTTGMLDTSRKVFVVVKEGIEVSRDSLTDEDDIKSEIGQIIQRHYNNKIIDSFKLDKIKSDNPTIDLTEYLIQNPDIPSIDKIILCGNSSRLEMVRSLIEQHIKPRQGLHLLPNAKTGVALGAALYATGDAGFQITGVERLPFAIGYSVNGWFKEIYQSGQSMRTAESFKSGFMTGKAKINIFKNSGWGHERQRVLNNPNIGHFGFIPVSADFKQCQIAFELKYKDGLFYYSLYKQELDTEVSVVAEELIKEYK